MQILDSVYFGKYYFEMEIGPTYGSYAAYGWVHRPSIPAGMKDQEYMYYVGLTSKMDRNEGIYTDLNNGYFGGWNKRFMPGGERTLKVDGGNTYISSSQQHAVAIDLDNKKYWIGTAKTKSDNLVWYPSKSGYDFSNDWDSSKPLLW